MLSSLSLRGIVAELGGFGGGGGLRERKERPFLFCCILKGVAILNSYFLVECLINGNIVLTDFESFCSIVRSSLFNSFWD
jgi:hypothetical protein